MYRYLFGIVFLWTLFSACSQAVQPDKYLEEVPPLFPDYVGVTIPANIAPLNFKLEETCDALAVEFLLNGKRVLWCQGRRYIHFPQKSWRRLLEKARGETLEVRVLAKMDGSWLAYKPFPLYVSRDSIDYSIAYRLIAPGYEVYSKMGIYQRELSTFEEHTILENTLITGSCVNCHSVRLTNPDDFSLHIRGKKGGTILMHAGETRLLNTKTPETMSNFVYPYWHPSGRYVAYSVNKTRQVFHEMKEKRVEVIDSASDVVIYDVENNRVLTDERLMRKDCFETFPAFSPDGKTLFFCSARAVEMPAGYKEVRYDLCRVDFDPLRGKIGTSIDTLVRASAKGKSVSFPRPSPDGKFMLFTLIDYGNFSIWHPEADLYLLDLKTHEMHALDEANSPDTESYHSWSSDSHWIVFSSRRIDGLYTRPYIAYVDEQGKARKPFLLPQEDPDYYIRSLYSFNIPEFVSKPIHLTAARVRQLVKKEGSPVQLHE